VKGDDMKKSIIFLSNRRSVYNLLLSLFLPVIFLSLLMFPSAAFCDSWQPIGPEGGNFIFSMTNPVDANEVTAITTSPSPSNVYRSTDGGISWNKIGEIPYSYIYDVSAFDFSTIYAISSSRCYRSTDGGASWTATSLPTSAGWAYRVCADPTDNRKVYVTGYIYDYQSYPYTYSMVFFKSTDGGVNWSALSFFSFDYFYPQDMAISRSNPNVIYIAGVKEVVTNNLYKYYGALFYSSDAGESWTDISDSVDSAGGNYFDSVAIDPTDENKVYVGGNVFYRSVKEGRGQELSWVRSSTRFGSYTINIDPIEPSRIYAGGYQSVSMSTDYGQSWITRYDCIRNLAQHVEISPAEPSNVYVASYSGLYKSSDSGVNWDSAHNGIYAASIAAIAVAPSTVIVQNSGLLMAYSRSGRTTAWHDLVTPESCGEVCDILINPDNSDIVLILEGYG
jgi:photosystem II stability/assembly factor-like uncharacterized protein